MDAFQAHDHIMCSYGDYLRSFLQIKDERIRQTVEAAFQSSGFLPEPLIQFNPSYRRDESLQTLSTAGIIHPDLPKIFGSYQLYQHQIEALRIGTSGHGFIVTSGTGSGKSLTYLATIFNYLLQLPDKKPGIKAILVYPMNALINSQEKEIEKYRDQAGPGFPISFAKYTGQESAEARERIKLQQPDIILTNYMMLELILTRHQEKWMREAIKEHLKFLVFDELHTYRGRQGSDVSMLIRRIKSLCSQSLICIGTSATMASSGDQSSRKQAVAEVASDIFGTAFSPEHIVEESLATCTGGLQRLPDKISLQTAIDEKKLFSGDRATLMHHPLATWLENRVALRWETKEDKLEDSLLSDKHTSLVRGRPMTLTAIAELLSSDSTRPFDQCRKALENLLKWCEQINKELAASGSRETVLPFKIHQFIGQTGLAYLTLEPIRERFITLETSRYHKEKGQEEKMLYPVLFSRHSGHEFLCVQLDFEIGLIFPRDPDEIPPQISQADLKGSSKRGQAAQVLSEEDFPAGYLVLPHAADEENIWTADDLANLPDSWFDKNGALKNYYAFRIPRRIYFDATGNFSFDPDFEQWGWYMPAKLLIDPTAGIIYQDVKVSENTKLMRLGNEGRSTATTILSFNAIHALHGQHIETEKQKLLSFTDNRQDASLQSGHFNDFMITGRLRSAIFHALRAAPDGNLKLENIAEKVFEVLHLPESAYAKTPSQNPAWPDPENESALKIYLLIRILYDLKRGWRYNLPNLEQCGLLNIAYKRLTAYCSIEEFWRPLPYFSLLSPDQREEVVIQVLDYFRTAFAIDHAYLSERRSEIENYLKIRLDESMHWSLDFNEQLEIPYILLPQAVGDTPPKVYTASIGPASNLGKYLKRKFTEAGLEPLRGQAYTQFIQDLCEVLYEGHFLKKELVTGKKAAVTGYRLRTDAIVWQLDSGKRVRPDLVRLATYKGMDTQPNVFFKAFYQQDFKRFQKPLVGREHTGQLGHQQRIEREDDFRKGDISALFCSPTMELGIDIADLNVVHMRNVPPNPANYAQRSGRAGRSGQTALVFTYCSAGSPHDRHYFANKEKMVAGVVIPPKIDLVNEELILSHLNAYLLMKLQLSSLHYAVSDLLDLSQAEALPLKAELKNYIREQIEHKKEYCIDQFLTTTASIRERLEASYWFSREWISRQVASFLTRFDQSLDRWRKLYRAAERTKIEARLIIDDALVKHGSSTWNEARRREKVALEQRGILLNENRQSAGSQSEFYVFRYLASEGFLPGYNFTRLPVRTYVGYRHQDQGEYISRPRFTALKEFGPNNLIYHNGSKYKVNRMTLFNAAVQTQEIKISKTTGYAFLGDEGRGMNNDPITKTALDAEDAVERNNRLLLLQESEALPRERISCEEEERRSTGYLIDQYFSYPKGMDATRQATLKFNDHPLLHCIYSSATRLIQINRKWKRTQAEGEEAGFFIDSSNGKWLRLKDLEQSDVAQRSVNVQLYTTDTADTLYLQPLQQLELPAGQERAAAITLAYALKRAIENQFQVEENEIGVWLMGEQQTPNIMLFEAAEGSLGILSLLVENGIVLQQLFRRAYELLHFDPITLEDLGKDTYPRSSYDDLLSYYNQRYHNELDRHLVKAPLERLMACRIDQEQRQGSMEAQYKYLQSSIDLHAATEQPFIDYLYRHGIRLPDRAQVNLEDYYISADFVYKNDSGCTLIFCDGRVHDQAEVKLQDARKRQLLRDSGYDVIEWHYSEPLEQLIERRKDIFRKVR